MYIANVCYTIVGERFAKWVDNRVKERNEKRQKEIDFIELDPDIAAIYNSSTAISSKYMTSNIVEEIFKILQQFHFYIR